MTIWYHMVHPGPSSCPAIPTLVEDVSSECLLRSHQPVDHANAAPIDPIPIIGSLLKEWWRNGETDSDQRWNIVLLKDLFEKMNIFFSWFKWYLSDMQQLIAIHSAYVEPSWWFPVVESGCFPQPGACRQEGKSQSWAENMAAPGPLGTVTSCVSWTELWHEYYVALCLLI